MNRIGIPGFDLKRPFFYDFGIMKLGRYIYIWQA